MADSGHSGPPSDGSPNIVKVRYVESREFRAHHTSGALGGINQLGEMYIAFVAERAPRALETQLYVFENGTTEVIPDTNVREDVITRELQTAVYMSPAAALELAHFIMRNLHANGFMAMEGEEPEGTTTPAGVGE